jgi:hypothetical protein
VTNARTEATTGEFPACSEEICDPDESPRPITPLFGPVSSLFLICSTTIFATYLSWPWPKLLMGQKLAAMEVRSMGRVVAVHFVGGFGTLTQVSTTEHEVLVEGIVELPKGIAMETRIDAFEQLLCQSGTDNCWMLRGPPPLNHIPNSKHLIHEVSK